MEQLNKAIAEKNLNIIREVLPTVHLSDENLYWILWSCIYNICTDGVVLSSNDIDCLGSILKYIDVNFKSKNGQSHLIHAISYNNIQLVQLLLENGATPILSDHSKNYFQSKGYIEVIDLIDNFSFPIKEPVSDT